MKYQLIVRSFTHYVATVQSVRMCIQDTRFSSRNQGDHTIQQLMCVDREYTGASSHIGWSTVVPTTRIAHRHTCL